MSRYLFLGVIIGAILGGGFGMLLTLIAGYWALKQLCDSLLKGKLICFGPPSCVIGQIMELKPPGVLIASEIAK